MGDITEHLIEILFFCDGQATVVKLGRFRVIYLGFVCCSCWAKILCWKQNQQTNKIILSHFDMLSFFRVRLFGSTIYLRNEWRRVCQHILYTSVPKFNCDIWFCFE